METQQQHILELERELAKKNRELEVEASLERVRSKTMAMQKQDDLLDVITTLTEQLVNLGIVVHDATFSNGLCEGDWDIWHHSPVTGITPRRIVIPWINHPYFNAAKEDIIEFREKGIQLHSNVFTKEEKNSFLDHLYKHTESWTMLTEETKAHLYAAPGYAWSGFLMEGTWVTISKFENLPYTAGENAVFSRFAIAFGQAYTRFLDLQRAEAQVKEAKTEAALERVRAMTMAMHSSADIGGTALIMLEELSNLEVDKHFRCGILVANETDWWEIWSAVFVPNDKPTLRMGKINVTGHSLFQYGYKMWKAGVPVSVYELVGDEVRDYYYSLLTASNYVHEYDFGTLLPREVCTIFNFPEGALFTFTPELLGEHIISTFKRFASVFSLTYRRYMDLQKAEASAKEALKQASLDRLRAEIASMRTSKDLERITPLVWKELSVLNVPFTRCGVFIIDEAEQQTNMYLSTPDGKAIVAFRLPFYSKGFTEEMLEHWRNDQMYTTHWDAATFHAWTQALIEEGVIKKNEKYTAEQPPEHLYLHFLPFLQGMLYVGNVAPLSPDAIELVQSLADAFSTAYARYEDFNKLEAAKQQIEATLSELKATQSQLIQKEKMASLGELTAGIAHEIQNPLNFVNNFSEVSNELIEELKAERNKKKDEQDGKLEGELLNDIEQNLQKIMLHGKRAESIVKGMLQHSRVNTGQREWTDINALTDEYLHLSYHGMRAKDKVFNAEIQTHFDKSIGKLNIVPQDISRVLLNLFNNAFYAVYEKKKLLNGTFEPLVSVTTAQQKECIIIKVTDNGNGIPQHIVDKIFQPFFTTKPTGQGTGLGLSLSYDIIKAHGGEIKVESKEGEGTTFIIQLSTL